MPSGVYLTTATPGHDGTDFGNSWSDAFFSIQAPVVGAPQGQRAAMLFFLPTRSNVSGIPGDATPILTPTTRITQATLTLRCVALAIPVGATALLFAEVVVNPNGLPFSNSNLPRRRKLANATLPATGIPISPLLVPPFNFTVQLNPQVVEAGHLSIGGGTVGIVLRAEVSAGATFTMDLADAESGANHPRLNTEEDAQLDTGIRGPFLRSSRADRCARSGIRAMREDMVRDGWQEGLYVLPEWWEPPDPYSLPRRTVEVREPVNDD